MSDRFTSLNAGEPNESKSRMLTPYGQGCGVMEKADMIYADEYPYGNYELIWRAGQEPNSYRKRSTLGDEESI